MNQSLVTGWRKRWNRTLLLFLRQRVGSRVDIEDLAQETYLRLLRARDLQGVGNPLAYLLTVAGHVVAEWRNQRAFTSVALEEGEQLLVDSRTPEFQLEARVSHQRLSETLAEISPTMRAVLLMRLRDGYPYKEISKELGITDRQVKRYLARGYERLRRTLED